MREISSYDFVKPALYSAGGATEKILRQMAFVRHKAEGLLDLYVREQMLNVVEPNLAVHLRERDPKSVDEMVRMADLYQEARREEKGRPKMVKMSTGL